MSRNIKRLLCGLLALILALGMTGCAELIDVALEVSDIYEQYEEIEESLDADAADSDSSEAEQERVDNATEPPQEESEEKAEDPSEESTSTEEPESSAEESEESVSEEEPPIDEYGSYTTKEDVALYIHTYGHLPENFITKAEARKLGWEGGSLESYAEGCCIGGDTFGNREGLLPKAEGRKYTECDIDTLGKSSRGAKRIVFSNDGLIFYTDDHYESFELLYGEY